MLKIKKTDKRKYAHNYLGLEPGDSIIAFDGHEVEDILDYTYYDSLSQFEITVLAKSGERVTVQVDKDEDASLGLTFEEDGLQILTCHNDCIFCFVKQMPEGMRSSLYVKDDDYRQSFLHGNFVTLTNLSDKQLERIIRLNLSPLYVSVQTMNAKLREKMLNNRFAGKIKEQLTRLNDAGIQINAQVVLVPGVNDGNELDYTLEQLYKLQNVLSIAVVPCGITKFREGLYPISDIDSDYAKRVIYQIQKINVAHGKNLVVPADEFYFKANLPLPSDDFYGDFLQVENGVGLSVKFRRDVIEKINEKKQVLPSGKYLTVCGTSVYNFMSEIVALVQSACKDVTISLLPIENKFFGSTVNCTGLLVGEDILNAVKNCNIDYDVLLIPDPCLMQGEDVFLDGMTISDMAKKLGKVVKRASIS